MVGSTVTAVGPGVVTALGAGVGFATGAGVVTTTTGAGVGFATGAGVVTTGDGVVGGMPKLEQSEGTPGHVTYTMPGQERSATWALGHVYELSALNPEGQAGGSLSRE
jgi:hypothetical protein